VRLNAAQWLVRGGGKASRKAADPGGRPNYGSTGRNRGGASCVVPVSDGAAEGQAGEAAAEHLSQVAEPLVEVAAKAEPARAEEEAPEPGEPATVEVSIVVASQPALSVPAGAHSLLFPAKCRRVPIQP